MCPGCSCDIAELAVEYRDALRRSGAIAMFFVSEFGELATIISRGGNPEVRLALAARVDDLPARLDAVLAVSPSAARH